MMRVRCWQRRPRFEHRRGPGQKLPTERERKPSQVGRRAKHTATGVHPAWIPGHEVEIRCDTNRVTIPIVLEVTTRRRAGLGRVDHKAVEPQRQEVRSLTCAPAMSGLAPSLAVMPLTYGQLIAPA
jgi:hypothetical protein